jgi:maleate isomerase
MNTSFYGYRARIGYTSPPATTEVFPYEFYETVPKGVTLVLTTLAVFNATADEVNRSYEISLNAAKNMGNVGVDLMVLGGVPINISRGIDKVDDLIRDTEKAIGVPVTTSVTAQWDALQKVGAKRITVGHPEGPARNPMFNDVLKFKDLNFAGAIGSEDGILNVGTIPLSRSIELCRKLKKAYPETDVIWLPCPHWAIGEAVEAIENELDVTVITANQAIVWHALRRCGIDDKLTGYGRLLSSY